MLMFLSVKNLNLSRFLLKLKMDCLCGKLSCSNENCFNVDSIQMWHAKMGHNNFSDLKRLPEFVEGMKIGD